MSYKYKVVTAKSPSLFLNQIRDFLVNDCGWTNETPAAIQTNDPGSLVHPCFLKSTGEDGTEELFFNLMNNYGQGTDSDWSKLQCQFSYLASGINATDTTINIDDSTRFVGNQGAPYGGIIRIGDELIWFTYQATNTFYGCRRGFNGTTPASHSADDVVLQEFNSYMPLRSNGPTIEAFAFRDVTTPLAFTSTPTTVSATTISSSTITGFVDARFANHCFVRITSGPMSGQMRRILTYTSTTGAFTYEPFPVSPGSVTFDVISSGFLPTFPRAITFGYRRFPQPRTLYFSSTLSVPPQPQIYFLYGSKDYLWVFTKAAGWTGQFFGNLIRHADKGYALTTGNISPGTNIVIPVSDVTQFYVGAKYRIIGRSVNDWIDNCARATFPGSGNPKLFQDEMVSEEIVIGAVGASDITINGSILASYRTGAIIGEDPRPMVTMAHSDNAINVQACGAFACYSPKTFGTPIRQMTPTAFYNYSALLFNTIFPCGGSSLAGGSPSWIVERNLGSLMTAYIQTASYHADNVWEYVKGVFPGLWRTNNLADNYMSAGLEDTFQARWNGQWRTFRFLFDGTYYSFVGPEIS